LARSNRARGMAVASSRQRYRPPVEDVLIAIVDALKGFPEAITAVFPQAQVQTCVVHLIRHSLALVSYKDRKAVAAALKQIYKAKDADAGKLALDDFAEGPWGKKYPAIAQWRRRSWSEVIPFFAFPDDAATGVGYG
jgi:putative transposase